MSPVLHPAREAWGTAADGSPLDGVLVTGCGRRAALAAARAAGYRGPVCAASDASDRVRWWAGDTVGWWVARYPRVRGSLRRVRGGWAAEAPGCSWGMADPDGVVERAEAIARLAIAIPWAYFRSTTTTTTTETWYRVGRVERGPRHRWYDGWSRSPTGAVQPWCTYREAQATSRLEGAVARFVRADKQAERGR